MCFRTKLPPECSKIETVFDRQKGAIYALYNRATRSNPELQGKLVLEFTISPAGETAPRNFHANNVTLGVHYEF